MDPKKQRQGKINKNKGAWYERLVCQIINDYLGTNFGRTPMSGGMHWKGDLMNKGKESIMDIIHFECKNYLNLHIQEWLRQAYTDAPSRKFPTVVAKIPRLFNTPEEFNKRIQHIVVLDLMDFLGLMKLIDEKGVPNEEQDTYKKEDSSEGTMVEESAKDERLKTLRKLEARYAEAGRERQEGHVQAAKKRRDKAREASKARSKAIKSNFAKKTNT